MKKLMIAAAIVCAAAFANAASCGWGVDWVYSTDGDKINTYDAGSVVNYWIVYLGDTSTSDGVKFDGKNITGGTAWTGGGDQAGTIDASGSGVFEGLNATYNGKYFAMVVYDKDNSLWGVSDAVQIAGIVDSPLHDADDITFKNDETLGISDEGYLVATQAVPEPTSGLLLLLGVAGLALKRRRA